MQKKVPYRTFCNAKKHILFSTRIKEYVNLTLKEVESMMFLKPKYVNVEPVEYKLSERTRKLVGHYANYTGLTDSQVLEEFLQNILEDQDFIEYIKSLRNNIRIKREFGIADE